MEATVKSDSELYICPGLSWPVAAASGSVLPFTRAARVLNAVGKVSAKRNMPAAPLGPTDALLHWLNEAAPPEPLLLLLRRPVLSPGSTNAAVLSGWLMVNVPTGA